MESGEHQDDCKQVFALLSQYLDAELSPASCEEIQAHLAACPPCIEFLESLKRTIRLCHHCESAEAPPLAPEAREQLLAAYRKTLLGRA
jgi:RNA polymerase sigma-70 factor (ECF subfamily)